ncbi:hypothetical protein [Nonomuraea insulae]|uniref:Uncharacterized protein n=1 Tax=Nonomuraea insulae TaxID=1616787 RepID=A0ABW1D9N5_9ACTN
MSPHGSNAPLRTAVVGAGDIGPGDPYYTELYGGAPGWAPAGPREEEDHA